MEPVTISVSLTSTQKGLRHGSERVATDESDGECWKIDTQAEHIQNRIHPLILWLLCYTLASDPQFLRLRVFDRASFWCRGGNGCRMACEFRTEGESEATRMMDRVVSRSGTKAS